MAADHRPPSRLAAQVLLRGGSRAEHSVLTASSPIFLPMSFPASVEKR